MEKRDMVQQLGDLLMEKETINLTDIIGVLGTRPAGMSETMKEYLHELTLRQEKEAQEKAEGEAEEAAEQAQETEEAVENNNEEQDEETKNSK